MAPIAVSFKESFLMTSIKPNKNSSEPWPTSPNMTPKRNGKVTQAKTAGLISLYVGTPYVLTIS